MEPRSDWAIKVIMGTLHTCMGLTADRYIFMVPCEILEEARCDMNKVRVPSDVGNGWHLEILQKSTYCLCPAAYVFLLDLANP